MPDDVFGPGLNRQIDAMFERFEIKRRGPGIVHRHDAAMFLGHRGNTGNVHHFKGEGAGASVKTNLVLGRIRARKSAGSMVGS